MNRHLFVSSALLLAACSGPQVVTTPAPVVVAPAPVKPAPIDLTVPPTLGAPPSLKLPPVTTRQLANGLRIVVIEQHELPLADAILQMRSGGEADPASRTGTAALVSAMLTEGTTSRTSLQIADQAAYLGVEVGAGSGWEQSTVSLHTPTAQLDSAMALFADIALHPAFPSADLERVRKERLTSLQQLRDRGPAIAAVSFRDTHGEINSAAFNKLDSTVVREEKGPFTWVAERSKYFLVAYRAQPGRPFSTLRMQGGHRVGKVAPEATASVALPIGADGTTGFDLYTGPQDFERLQRLGGDLDQVNPYGSFLRGVVQPFTTIVMRALLWMKRTTQLNYGWVLVLFGVLIRLALWPLSQGAMRTSMKMQVLQPELQAIQKKYSDDPKRQQEAIMKVYKDHGMSPLSPLMGCLPMLLPMPILFALYFVFQNTIEFRGVPFLWLPDLSLRDPFYITPVLMGVSMFVMSWIGLRGSPPNPQAKMMSYMMPVMLTVLFLNFASGLNLYYAVQNIANIPQQWLLARERAKNPPPASRVQGPGIAVKKRS